MTTDDPAEIGDVEAAVGAEDAEIARCLAARILEEEEEQVDLHLGERFAVDLGGRGDSRLDRELHRGRRVRKNARPRIGL